MLFNYDRISGVWGPQQFKTYLENEWYIQDLKRDSADPINYQLIEVRRALANSDTKIIESHAKLANSVCGSIQVSKDNTTDKINETNWKLNNINESIDDLGFGVNCLNENIENLHQMLEWKFELLLEEQKLTNNYLAEISERLMIPDSQLQKTHHIKRGLTYLKSAINEGENSDYYNEALDEFLKSYAIDSKDYFSLHKLGLIYFSSLKHLDLSKSFTYFKEANRHSKAENFANEKNMESQSIQASSDYYSSLICLINNQLELCEEYANKAYNADPANNEYAFQYAKSLLLNCEIGKCNGILKKIIENDKNYFIKIIIDQDFIKEPKVVTQLQAIATYLIEKVSNKIAELKSMIISGSKYEAQLSIVEQNFRPANYLNARIVADSLF